MMLEGGKRTVTCGSWGIGEEICLDVAHESAEALGGVEVLVYCAGVFV